MMPLENAEAELTSKGDAQSDNSDHRGGEEGNVEAMLGEEVFDQIAVISCHKDIIKSVQYIEVTDQPLIFTAGMDKLAKIWNLQGELQGTLKQGYMRFTDYQWNFPVHSYRKENEVRKDGVQQMLKGVRTKRDEEVMVKNAHSRKVGSLRSTGQAIVGDPNRSYFSVGVDASTH